MAGTDPVDTHGHDLDDAQAQEPTLDVGADPASETQPDGDPNVLVLAQSAEEVQAQIDNVPGGSAGS